MSGYLTPMSRYRAKVYKRDDAARGAHIGTSGQPVNIYLRIRGIVTKIDRAVWW